MNEKKPMPYTPWKVCDCGDDTLPPHVDQNGPRDTLPIADVAEVISNVHLTDAECAAEYWRAEMDRHSLGDGYPIEHWGGELGTGMASEEIAFPRFDAIQRFATLPHAHEEDQS